MKKDDFTHGGHRERVRYVVENNSLKNLPEYQTLEFILFYGIPYKDTKPIAYALLNKFGSLKNVFTADVASLMQVKNMTRNAALLLRSFGDVYESVFKETREAIVLGPNNILPYLKDIFHSDETERLVLICLAADNSIISCTTLAFGDPESIILPTKDLMNVVIRTDAKKIILAHNHPSKSVLPSRADYQSTDVAGTVANAIGVQLVDHIIISGDTAYSCFLRCRMSMGEDSVYPLSKRS